MTKQDSSQEQQETTIVEDIFKAEERKITPQQEKKQEELFKIHEKKPKLINSVIAALIIATIFRSLLFEPFHIPSGSMKPGLIAGDYIFVSKYSFGYSRYSFPFALKLFSGRIFAKKPQRGDIIVFKLPKNPDIHYIKRLIGLPGDKVRIKDSVIHINDKPAVLRTNQYSFKDYQDEYSIVSKSYNENFLPEFSNYQEEYQVIEQRETLQDNTKEFIVPADNYFFMGDNRDNSEDSRFEAVGFVPFENFVGKAEIIFFSHQYSLWNFLQWKGIIASQRFFKKII
jgi:signal peptidase I